MGNNEPAKLAQPNADWQIILYFCFIKGGQILSGINQSTAMAATCHTILVQTASDSWATHTETEGHCFPCSDDFSSEIQPLVNLRKIMKIQRDER
jgi:hypothetical protein